MKRMTATALACILCLCAGKVTAQEKEPVAVIDTDMGKIRVKLYGDTPLHRDNFLKLADGHHYDGLLFHRVIKQFMIQGGDPKSKDAPDSVKLGDGDPDYTIPAEIVFPKYFHKYGQLCAARTGDDMNPEKASSPSQFYIVTGKHFTERELDRMEAEKGVKLTPEQRRAYMIDGGAPHLDGAYTVFGEVIEGMKVVDRMQFVPVDENDRPLKNIKIKSVKIVKK
ncbi:MAG: peptidylprolyl isomerase [Tannerella sp.]|nr:peptidylprolyl isomerase [Tannerella sp.]